MFTVWDIVIMITIAITIGVITFFICIYYELKNRDRINELEQREKDSVDPRKARKILFDSFFRVPIVDHEYGRFLKIFKKDEDNWVAIEWNENDHMFHISYGPRTRHQLYRNNIYLIEEIDIQDLPRIS